MQRSEEPIAGPRFVNGIWPRQLGAPVLLGVLKPLSSALRQQQQPSCLTEGSRGDDVPVKQVAFTEEGKDSEVEPALKSPRTPQRRRNTTPPPRAACVEPDGLVEGDNFPTGSLLLVRLRPFFGKKADRCWYIYEGRARGVAPDGRRNERVRIYLPSLGLEAIGPTPVVQHHRLPAAWLTQYLYTCPLDLEERGVAIQAVSRLGSRLGWCCCGFSGERG